MAAHISDLTAEERSLVGQCLIAASSGPYFENWEFQTLFGIERSIVEEIATLWPDVDPTNENVELAVVGAMNHLLGYPHGHSVHDAIGYEPSAIRSVLEKVTA